MIDANEYVGLPFLEKGRTRSAGVDCWGLARLVLSDAFGIELPSYDDAYATTLDAKEIGALVRTETMLRGRQVSLSDAKEGDVLILRMRGQPMHCAIVLSPPKFLHVATMMNVVVESWDGFLWRDRVVGCWRHPALEGR